MYFATFCSPSPGDLRLWGARLLDHFVHGPASDTFSRAVGCRQAVRPADAKCGSRRSGADRSMVAAAACPGIGAEPPLLILRTATANLLTTVPRPSSNLGTGAWRSCSSSTRAMAGPAALPNLDRGDFPGRVLDRRRTSLRSTPSGLWLSASHLAAACLLASTRDAAADPGIKVHVDPSLRTSIRQAGGFLIGIPVRQPSGRQELQKPIFIFHGTKTKSCHSSTEKFLPRRPASSFS